MSKIVLRCSHLSLPLSVLLLLGVAGAVPAEESRRTSPKASPVFRAAAPPEAASCDGAVPLRSEDLVQWGVVSLDKTAACHAAVSCQPAYPSCAGWSSYSTCGDPFCREQFGCGECTCDEFGICVCARGPATFVPYERFRVCFDQFGNSCTEWDRLNTYTCGCAG